ncbi:hypothetical protein RhiJN_27512 [Ceratobasidium sp. AG-Ba]|nr:hypothetical protein RhiJN_13449 [Ceratobasidium sp. AG-Ba]QRV99493.1 hypothetical protein RhiJN_27512 [Ceratobasidium sp. AG-Ba]QRW14003.1 hypothetical protein RhiLY_13002 [Ceratobasidium sp. AG-Ba]
MTQPILTPVPADLADITLPGMPGGMPQDQAQILHPQPNRTIHISQQVPPAVSLDDSVNEVDKMTCILHEQGEEALLEQQTQPPLAFGDQEGNLTQQPPRDQILVPSTNNPIQAIALALHWGLSTLKHNVIQEVQKSIKAAESNRKHIEEQKAICEVTQGETSKAVNNSYVAAQSVTTLVSKAVYFLFWIQRRRRQILA